MKKRCLLVLLAMLMLTVTSIPGHAQDTQGCHDANVTEVECCQDPSDQNITCEDAETVIQIKAIRELLLKAQFQHTGNAEIACLNEAFMRAKKLTFKDECNTKMWNKFLHDLVYCAFDIAHQDSISGLTNWRLVREHFRFVYTNVTNTMLNEQLHEI